VRAEPRGAASNGYSAAFPAASELTAPATHFHLVEMPWHALGAAPLALAVVRGILGRTHPGITVTEHYLNLRWAEYLLDVTGGQLTPRHYQDVADNGIPAGAGDWIFAGVLYEDPRWRHDEFLSFASQCGIDVSVAMRMRALAEDFIDMTAREIAAMSPDLIGFTTTFMQNVPSLALARRLRQLGVSAPTIFGGANCDGPMGAALHRNHRFVDFVVRGEAELALPQLVSAILAGQPADGIDGVCWWRDGEAIANPQLQPAVPATSLPEVDYDSWHRAFTTSPVAEYAAPYLVVEGSRGCWWGQVHQCTFCGLNNSSITFREKPAAQLWTEISRLVERYKILDIVTSDNIMSMRYFQELLPRIADTGWDLRIHYEVKANVRARQIEQLADAGVAMVQFGIESFSTRVLKLMDKGVDGPSLVAVLRDCQDYGVSVEWNYLYGFPGETADDYWPVIAQLPALVHLEPPAQGCGSRIALERFSPYFEMPELGFTERRHASFYDHVYRLPDADIDDLAYYFDCADLGIRGAVETALNRTLAEWENSFPDSYLYADTLTDGTLRIVDGRNGWPQRDIDLTGWQQTAYGVLSRPRGISGLRARLASSGEQATEADVRAWLGELVEQGLAFHDAGKWVALATTGRRAKLRRAELE
jgi:ribosomal peptide maturation radical SAM protein 1